MKKTRTKPEGPARDLRNARVAVLVDTSTSWGQRVHRGIHNYDRQHGSWQLFVEARGLEEKLSVPGGWRGDGIIARVRDNAMALELKALGLPVVNVSGISLKGAVFPTVTTDLEASAQMAAKHFLERGFRHFAYFSLMGLPYVAAQQQAFAQAVSEAEGDFQTFAVRPRAGAEPDWNLDLARLGSWLKSLSKPVAIFTWNPSSAREIIYACHVTGLMVPEEVAVLSGTDDELLCNLVHIPISGILVPAEQIGHRAAELLHALMRGQKAPENPILIPPRDIVTRQSSDTLAIRDPVLAKALSFIRQNATTPVQVSEVARHAGVSRRVLERRFDQAFGRAPAEEIRRVHIERAKQLLAETDIPIPDVAEASGFGSPEYLAFVFRKDLQISPRAYRKETRRN